ncbi:MAG TPA: hypothetical protein VKA30_11155 [Actinomycetota bacterium]|nr:hypothetical protein [Actinomycetota bacterium]
MRTTVGIVGIALILTGVVWIFQGAGTLKGSFMTGSVFWLWMGVVAAAAGVPLLVIGLRRSRSR